MSKTLEIFESIKKLTALEIVELLDMFKDQYGITAAAMAVGGGAAAADADASSGDASFDVKLTSYPAEKKTSLIKLVRELSGLGLGEAKTYVESDSRDNFTVLLKKEYFNSTDADQLIAKITEAGGQAEKVKK